MKRYWPLLLIALVFVAIVGVSQYAESAKEHCEDSAREVKAASVAKGDDGKTSNDAEKSCKPPIWARYVTWPEGITTWALILTLGAFVWQATLMDKHAKHFEDLASATKNVATAGKDTGRAALLHAQAIINSQRAWLVVTPQRDPHKAPFPTENWINVLTNQGRTPAVVISIHIDRDFVSAPDLMPVAPVYRAQVTTPGRLFIVGQNDLRVGLPMDPSKDIYKLQSADKFLVWYGRILYEDVFQTPGEVAILHETRWCYAWIPSEKRFAICGPEEYNRNT